jgi:hypothetical protein
MEILKNMFEDFGKIFNDNSAAVYDTPIDVLEAMWQVKWSNEWIPAEEIKADTFWVNSFLRLANNDLLESHRIITGPDGHSDLVYRLKK